ncbi:MAG TPA: prolyl oligopeptidase family serine peptidase [Draconibacterium sp.]|nr:prolyl oligopeptidase family serine peptidase [Draconibacterium sp.]
MKSLFNVFSILFILSVVLFSCDNFEDVPAENNNVYLTSSTSVGVHSITEINTLIGMASIQYPDLASISNRFTAPVEVYKITYYTTFEGNKKEASGLVCVPKVSGTYPLMSFQNGTNTLNSAAPSVAPNSDLFRLLSLMASSGFVLSIPDYLGFGAADDMFHPYLDKESTVQTVVDMMRATKELIAEIDSIDLNKDLYITGYSQGGWSTMQLQKTIETNYSGDFNLKASACGAGPYNLVAINDYVLAENTYPMPYFLGYIMNSFSNLRMTTPIDSVFNEPYASRIPGLYDGSKDGTEINAQLTTNVTDLFVPNYVENWNKPGIYESLYSMMESNSISGYNTQVPTLLLHGTADTFVPPFTSQNLYNEFIAAGVSTNLVHYMELDGLDHTGAVIPAELKAIIWFLQIRDGAV